MSRPAFQTHPHPPHIFSDRTWHPMHHETIDGLISATKAYFSLPLVTKMKVAFPLGYILFFISHSRWWLYHRRIENFQGYAPFLDSNIDPFNRGDLLEGFAAGWEELALEENDETSGNNDHPVTIPRQVRIYDPWNLPDSAKYTSTTSLSWDRSTPHVMQLEPSGRCYTTSLGSTLICLKRTLTTRYG